MFQHGEGRGATGCIVMSPPVFLSEEEALQVIREEMTAKGVQLGTNQTTVAGITVERIAMSVPKASAGTTQEAKPARPAYEIKQEPLKVDAADLKKKVYIEFLGQADAWRWDRERGQEEGNWSMSTVQSYDLPKTADYVSARIKRQTTDKLYFGTFYDPMAGTLDFSKLRAKNPSWGQNQPQSRHAAIGEPDAASPKPNLRFASHDHCATPTTWQPNFPCAESNLPAATFVAGGLKGTIVRFHQSI